MDTIKGFVFVMLYIDFLVGLVYLLASGFSGHWVIWPWIADANMWQLITYQFFPPAAIMFAGFAAVHSSLPD